MNNNDEAAFCGMSSFYAFKSNRKGYTIDTMVRVSRN